MRNYLYLWRQPELKRLIASGIEFCDLVPELASAGGLVLLRHRFDEASFDPASGFDFVPADDISRLAADAISRYGDFSWADMGSGVELGGLSDQAVAELAFFGRKLRPLGQVEIPGLGNHFLCYGHDDGWYLRIWYARWEPVESMLRRLLPAVLSEAQARRTLDLVRRGEGAFWCQGGRAVACEQTEDIDALQSSRA